MTRTSLPAPALSWLLAASLPCAIVACGTTEEDDGSDSVGADGEDGSSGGNTSNTGGASSGGGATDERPRYSSEIPLALTGPGIEAGELCAPVACEGLENRTEWTLSGRCDSSGIWVDPSCPAAELSWSLTRAEGTFSFMHMNVEWSVSTTTNWTISYPADCGGCAPFTDGPLSGPWSTLSGMLNSRWNSIECAEEAGGDCACTGTLTREENYKGSDLAVAGTGNFLLEELPTPETVGFGEDQDKHLITHCTSGSDLLIVDENGGHYRFTAR